jgi:hypothetical protein
MEKIYPLFLRVTPSKLELVSSGLFGLGETRHISSDLNPDDPSAAELTMFGLARKFLELDERYCKDVRDGLRAVHLRKVE